MAYDPATKQLVLFGGDTSDGLVADTWVWTGSDWTEQSPPSAPSDRSAAAMAYDPAAKQLVLFGGDTSNGLVGDTWVWSGRTWAAQATSAEPSPRAATALAYDAGIHGLLLFGGQDEGAGQLQFLSDTWEWTGNTWAKRTPSAHPSARASATMTPDVNGRPILFGGVGGSASQTVYDGDTWTFSS